MTDVASPKVTNIRGGRRRTTPIAEFDVSTINEQITEIENQITSNDEAIELHLQAARELRKHNRELSAEADLKRQEREVISRASWELRNIRQP